MKKSELRNIIKEEIQKVKLNELSNNALDKYISLAKEKGHNDLANKLNAHKKYDNVVVFHKIPFSITNISKVSHGNKWTDKYVIDGVKFDTIDAISGRNSQFYVKFDKKTGKFLEVNTTIITGGLQSGSTISDRESANLISNICKQNGFNVEPRQLMDYNSPD